MKCISGCVIVASTGDAVNDASALGLIQIKFALLAVAEHPFRSVTVRETV